MAKRKPEPVPMVEVDVTCDSCGGDTVIDDGERESICTRCGGTGLVPVMRPASTRNDRT
jgi:DnaJ-class molecular chaperone